VQFSASGRIAAATFSSNAEGRERFVGAERAERGLRDGREYRTTKRGLTRFQLMVEGEGPQKETVLRLVG